jgi:4-hydroxy-tetrahydrodipicolinate synthase
MDLRHPSPVTSAAVFPKGFASLIYHGSICALATPFAADESLDLDAFARLLEHQLAGGTQGVVVAGSTGEAHALEVAELDRLVRHAVTSIAGRVPVIVGTGGANTKKTIRATQHARDLGADAALVVTPYYVRPTQEGLRQHYLEVAAQGGLPIILYNVPGRTGCDLLPETVAQLVGHPNIVGIKEARAEPERMQALLPLRSETFSVLSGDDPTAARALLAGADGVISVANNVAPQPFRQLCDAARSGRAGDVRTLTAQLQPLFDALGLESNPIPVKFGLSLLGICSPTLRLPLTRLGDVHHAAVRAAIAGLRERAA